MSSLLSFLTGTLIPSWGSTLTTSSKLNYFPKALYPNTITWGVRTLTQVWGMPFSPSQVRIRSVPIFGRLNNYNLWTTTLLLETPLNFIPIMFSFVFRNYFGLSLCWSTENGQYSRSPACNSWSTNGYLIPSPWISPYTRPLGFYSTYYNKTCEHISLK